MTRTVTGLDGEVDSCESLLLEQPLTTSPQARAAAPKRRTRDIDPLPPLALPRSGFLEGSVVAATLSARRTYELPWCCAR